MGLGGTTDARASAAVFLVRGAVELLCGGGDNVREAGGTGNGRSGGGGGAGAAGVPGRVHVRSGRFGGDFMKSIRFSVKGVSISVGGETEGRGLRRQRADLKT